MRVTVERSATHLCPHVDERDYEGHRISPWLRHHSDLIVPTLSDARQAIIEYVNA